MGADLDDQFRPPLAARPAVRAICERLISPIREAARALGYAVGVHGSLERDLDLIACPWTDEAADEGALIEAVRLAVQTTLGGKCWKSEKPTGKPHGRRVWTLLLAPSIGVQSTAGLHPFIDLSVMPRSEDY